MNTINNQKQKYLFANQAQGRKPDINKLIHLGIIRACDQDYQYLIRKIDAIAGGLNSLDIYCHRVI